MRYYVAAQSGNTAERQDFITRRHIFLPGTYQWEMWRATFPLAGDLFVFRGKRGDQIKCLWHDGLGMSLYVKRLERGRFVWPPAVGDVVAISQAQLSYMLSGIDWRNPVYTFRPALAG